MAAQMKAFFDSTGQLWKDQSLAGVFIGFFVSTGTQGGGQETTAVDISSSESFLHGGELPTLIVQSSGHAVHIFINGQLSGSAFGTRENKRFTYTGKVNLHTGTNKIALLSVAIGLPNVEGHFETWNTGIQGPVALRGLDQGKWDLSWQKWTYQVGLKGESMNLVSPNGISSVDWMQGSLAAQTQQSFGSV